MNEKEQTKRGLPLPEWCFVLLGVPTFYMPLAYLALAVWAIGGMLTGVVGGPPELMKAAVHPALYVTFAMWPVYIAWVGLSKRLTRREKGMWLFIVILANMVGMPMFYVFMIRRYLGVEGRTGKRDEISLDRFLKCHEIAREQLSLAQLSVLRSYCRKHRLTKWGVVPLVAVAALAFYTAVFFVPKNCVRLFADFTPTRVVIVDSTTDSKKEIAPNSEAQKLHVQNVMMVGAMAGMIGAMGLFALAQVMSQLWGNWHRKAFIDFLKANNKDLLTTKSSQLPNVISGPQRSANKMRRKIIVSVILALILVGGIFGFLIWRHNNLRNQCKNRLRQLYCPMECCMPLELGLTNGAPLDPKILATYLKDKKIPKCPCGPEYEIIWVVGGPLPKCPYHGDLLAAIPNINDHNLQKGERVQSEPDVIITKAIEPYQAKSYSELVKMVNAEPKTIDVKWSCSKAYQVAIWAMWENESNGNICVMGMVKAKEGEDVLIPHKRSFIKSPSNQFVGKPDKD